MNDWVRIQTFARVHQAELRKDILEKNDISAVIINERDSLFLFGEIELFVSKENERKAKALINEFDGLTKINSFTELKPILLFQKVLQGDDIQTILKKKEDYRYILDNFELYVKNIDLEKTIPFLTGEKLTGWKKVAMSRKVRQAKHRVDLLSENQINTIVIKKKDSDFHLEEVNVYVQDEDLDKSNEILLKLNSWINIREYSSFNDIERADEILANEGIKSLITKIEEKKFELSVEGSNEETAIDILNLKREWAELKLFENIVPATYFRDSLIENNIPAVIINEHDSSFLIGQVELHVEKMNIEKAVELLKAAENSEK